MEPEILGALLKLFRLLWRETGHLAKWTSVAAMGALFFNDDVPWWHAFAVLFLSVALSIIFQWRGK